MWPSGGSRSLHSKGTPPSAPLVDPAPCILRRYPPTLSAPRHLYCPSQTPSPSLAPLPHLAPALSATCTPFLVPSQTPPLHLTTCAPPTSRPCTRPGPAGTSGAGPRDRGGGAGPISWNQSRRPPPLATPSPCRAAAHLLLCHNVFQSGEANCPIRAGASGFHLCRRLINMLLLAAADKFQKQVVKGFCLYPAWKIRGVTSRNMNRWHFSFLLLSSPSPCSAKGHGALSVRVCACTGELPGRRGE